jgi:hypothetical protein
VLSARAAIAVTNRNASIPKAAPNRFRIVRLECPGPQNAEIGAPRILLSDSGELFLSVFN